MKSCSSFIAVFLMILSRLVPDAPMKFRRSITGIFVGKARNFRKPEKMSLSRNVLQPPVRSQWGLPMLYGSQDGTCVYLGWYICDDKEEAGHQLI